MQAFAFSLQDSKSHSNPPSPNHSDSSLHGDHFGMFDDAAMANAQFGHDDGDTFDNHDSPDGNHLDHNDTDGSGAKRRSRRPPNTAERRANHNQVERHRRETLNGYFNDLAKALPSVAHVKKPSKALIVTRSLEFVENAAAREAALAEQNDALRTELNELRARLGMPPSEKPLTGFARSRQSSNAMQAILPGHHDLPSGASTDTAPSPKSSMSNSPSTLSEHIQSPSFQSLAGYGIPAAAAVGDTTTAEDLWSGTRASFATSPMPLAQNQRMHSAPVAHPQLPNHMGAQPVYNEDLAKYLLACGLQQHQASAGVPIPSHQRMPTYPPSFPMPYSDSPTWL